MQMRRVKIILDTYLLVTIYVNIVY